MPDVRTIYGDWMRNGYIDNLNRERRLDFAVIDGAAYPLDDLNQPATYCGRIDINADDCLMPAGGSVSFCPDPGEIERVGGRELFRPI